MLSGSFDPSDHSTGCRSSQNGRGGLFFVLSDPQLHADVTALISGSSAAYSDNQTTTNATSATCCSYSASSCAANLVLPRVW